jgi:hypothetical protein
MVMSRNCLTVCCPEHARLEAQALPVDQAVAAMAAVQPQLLSPSLLCPLIANLSTCYPSKRCLLLVAHVRTCATAVDRHHGLGMA